MALKVVSREYRKDFYAVSLEGSLDSDTHLTLEKILGKIMKPETKGVIFNMENLSYISSIGFSVIFKAKQTLEKNGGGMAIASLQPNVEKVFEAVKVFPDSVFTNMTHADSYLDAYIANVNKKALEEEKGKY